MIGLFGYIRELLKIDTVCIDNKIFRLHYKVTVIILTTFSLIVTANQYVGDPINCVSGGAQYNMMDTYCWIHSTFTLSNRVVGRAGTNFVQPGVASPAAHGKDVVKYHKYYQWVCFVLFFQAVLFYMPRYAWKTLEGGRMRALVPERNTPGVFDERTCDRMKVLVMYFARNLHRHNAYVTQFILCELCNFVNAVGQVYFINHFLDGEFSTYGLDVLWFTDMDPEKRADPMARVFPKVTKCSFYKYGSSGALENIDGLCVLPLNAVNEKIYVFLWYWLWLVTAVTGFNLVYRAAVVLMPAFRMLLLRARSRFSPQYELDIINAKFQVGDWFVLYQLSKNIDTYVFKELVTDLAEIWNDNTELI